MSIRQTADTAQATLREFEGADVIEQIERMDKPYTSETVLRAMYWGATMSIPQIAERFGVTYGEVYKWIERHEIETRSPQEGLQIRRIRDGDSFRTGSSGDSNSSGTSKWSFQD